MSATLRNQGVSSAVNCLMNSSQGFFQSKCYTEMDLEFKWHAFRILFANYIQTLVTGQTLDNKMTRNRMNARVQELAFTLMNAGVASHNRQTLENLLADGVLKAFDVLQPKFTDWKKVFAEPDSSRGGNAGSGAEGGNAGAETVDDGATLFGSNSDIRLKGRTNLKKAFVFYSRQVSRLISLAEERVVEMKIRRHTLIDRSLLQMGLENERRGSSSRHLVQGSKGTSLTSSQQAPIPPPFDPITAFELENVTASWTRKDLSRSVSMDAHGDPSLSVSQDKDFPIFSKPASLVRTKTEDFTRRVNKITENEHLEDIVDSLLKAPPSVLPEEEGDRLSCNDLIQHWDMSLILPFEKQLHGIFENDQTSLQHFYRPIDVGKDLVHEFSLQRHWSEFDRRIHQKVTEEYHKFVHDQVLGLRQGADSNNDLSLILGAEHPSEENAGRLQAFRGAPTVLYAKKHHTVRKEVDQDSSDGNDDDGNGDFKWEDMRESATSTGQEHSIKKQPVTGARLRPTNIFSQIRAMLDVDQLRKEMIDKLLNRQIATYSRELIRQMVLLRVQTRTPYSEFPENSRVDKFRKALDQERKLLLYPNVYSIEQNALYGYKQVHPAARPMTEGYASEKCPSGGYGSGECNGGSFIENTAGASNLGISASTHSGYDMQGSNGGFTGHSRMTQATSLKQRMGSGVKFDSNDNSLEALEESIEFEPKPRGTSIRPHSGDKLDSSGDLFVIPPPPRNRDFIHNPLFPLLECATESPPVFGPAGVDTNALCARLALISEREEAYLRILRDKREKMRMYRERIQNLEKRSIMNLKLYNEKVAALRRKKMMRERQENGEWEEYEENSFIVPEPGSPDFGLPIKEYDEDDGPDYDQQYEYGEGPIYHHGPPDAQPYDRRPTIQGLEAFTRYD